MLVIENNTIAILIAILDIV